MITTGRHKTVTIQDRLPLGNRIQCPLRRKDSERPTSTEGIGL